MMSKQETGFGENGACSGKRVQVKAWSSQHALCHGRLADELSVQGLKQQVSS